MKKVIFALAILGISASTLNAQTILKLGPEIGGTFVTMSQTYNGVSRETQYQPGFRIGGVLDAGFSDLFSIQTGVFFTANSGTESIYSNNFYTGGHVPASFTDRRRYHINYLRVPLYFTFKTGDKFKNRFFFGIGAYGAMAIGGRYQQDYTNTLNGQSVVKRYNYPINIGTENNDEISQFDFGAQAAFGYETKLGLYFKLYYSYGLFNTSPIGDSRFFNDDFNDYHQMGGGLCIGFLFYTNSKQKPRF